LAAPTVASPSREAACRLRPLLAGSVSTGPNQEADRRGMRAPGQG